LIVLRTIKPVIAIVAITIAVCTTSLHAQRYMESLGRGVVAIYQGQGQVYVGWRLLGTDPEDIAFTLYRSSGGDEPVRINARTTRRTNWVDTSVDTSQSNSYFVRPVLDGVEQQASAPFVLAADAPVRPYLSVPLNRPVGPYVSSAGYIAGDASVGDLDGDGEYEIVLKWEDNPKDNAHDGYTNSTILDAYTLDGVHLWRIDLGINIREGAHYTQFMVYDLDSDGRAEVACKTADGTVDGLGDVIGDAGADYRSSSGRVLSGPEYLTIFDGLTGEALATTDYVPARGNVCSWGDCYGNRVDRFLACVAYLDGERPSLVMCRGYYTRAVLAAWNWRDGELTNVWTFDSDDGTPGNRDYRGQGNHNLSVADVDYDGKDEIIYGACCIDHDGTGYYTTGLGHGDAMHVSDMDPDRPGLEVFDIHENPPHAYGVEFRDATTGEPIWGAAPRTDVGRGVAMDIDPRYPGYECWANGGAILAGALFNCRGEVVANRKPSSTNMGVWWDDDLLREILDGTTIDKWNHESSTSTRLLTAYTYGVASNNGTKANPCLSADILGDWREEVIWRTTDSSELRIFTTTVPTTHRFYTFMHDPVYRLGIAWQNVAYNQPPHTSFYMGEGMSMPDPQIRVPESQAGTDTTSP
jgi:rhamnogalacturonan endolyase